MAGAHENTRKMRRGRAIGMCLVKQASCVCTVWVSEHQHISHTHYSLAALYYFVCPKYPIIHRQMKLNGNYKLHAFTHGLHGRWCAFTTPNVRRNRMTTWFLFFFQSTNSFIHNTEQANEWVRGGERRDTSRNVIAQKLIILAHRVHIYDTTSYDLFMYGIRRVFLSKNNVLRGLPCGHVSAVAW